ncbi:key lime pathogenicity [Pyrenophora seminiperda CCB06]|uniref:Key lime pathogenicity n=1 Tax=Pyrenophora seminiperda CCB06 TaxID=1302712 RepID=A0A3M7MCI8_9PLEO|nr:key lime pathogenicity [Pyrenophora seminiperda CCB06]
MTKNGKEVRENIYRLAARNAQDFQSISVANSSFENVELKLDPTGSRPVSARFSHAIPFQEKHRVRNSEAMQTFRGTLIDGILQPNVRLGNGLCLSDDPGILDTEVNEGKRTATRPLKGVTSSEIPNGKPLHQLDAHLSRNRSLRQRSDKPLPQSRSSRALPRPRDLERREAQIAERERELLQIQQRLLLQTVRNQSFLPRRKRAVRAPREEYNTSHEHRIEPSASAHTFDEPSPRIADIEARERALQQQEELLRYKRKAWLLEQKLAQATERPPSRRVPRRHRDVGMEEVDAPSPHEPRTDQGAISDVQYDRSDGDTAPDHDLGYISPPDALKRLRSRIQLPTRGTLRSNKGPRRG